MSLSAVLNTMLALAAAFAAGASIAIMGNKVGRRTGRGKLSLFGLRPRHTATLMTAFTGGLIAVVTLLISLALSGQMAVIQGRYSEMQRRLQEVTDQYEVMRRQGRLLVGARTVLAMEAVEPGLPEERVRALVTSVVASAEAQVRQRYYAMLTEAQQSPREPGGSLLAYDPRQFRATVDALLAARMPQAVEIQVAENAWLDGREMNPVAVSLQAVSVFRVYQAGDVVARAEFSPDDPDLLGRLVAFVYEGVAASGRRARMPANPMTGRIDVQVGASSALDWSTPLFRALESASGPVEVQARAARDLYSLGRLDVVLVVPKLGVRVPASEGGG